MVDRLKKQWPLLAVWFCLVFVSRHIELGFMVGSKHAHFSALSAILPIIAYTVSPLLALLSLASCMLFLHGVHPICITLGIPTFFATLSWQASREKNGIKTFLMHIALPLACMLLFYFSPSGHNAWAYSLYWLIPLVLYFFPPMAIFRALQSTFVAHAIGSIMWAYIVPMTSERWISLIPVVAVERLLLAGFALIGICVLDLFRKQSSEYVLGRGF